MYAHPYSEIIGEYQCPSTACTHSITGFLEHFGQELMAKGSGADARQPIRRERKGSCSKQNLPLPKKTSLKHEALWYQIKLHFSPGQDLILETEFAEDGIS